MFYFLILSLRQLYAPSLAAMASTAAVRLRGRFRGSSFVQLEVQAGPMGGRGADGDVPGRWWKIWWKMMGDDGRCPILHCQIRLFEILVVSKV